MKSFLRLLATFFHAYTMVCGQQEKASFAIKTPYALHENTDVLILRPQPQCKVKQLNFVHRHGHRFPSKNYILNFKELSKLINWKVESPPEMVLGLPWEPPLDEDHKSHLTHVGEKELYNIGIRTRKRFPELFEQRYNTRRFKFMSTNKLRTTHSATSLAAGLFDGDGSLHGRIQPIALDISPNDCRVLRFYDNCHRYKQEIKKNAIALSEHEKFLHGKEIKKVADKIKVKLNLPSIRLTHRSLDAIFIGCAYELSMFDGSLDTGLCSLLDDEDRRVLEYADDLEKFYTSANPNNPLTYQIACPLLKDMLDYLQASRDGDTMLVGIFRSAHSTAMLMMYTLLGLNKQHVPLRSENFQQILNWRRQYFRSSQITPFAANFYFVLYECSGEWKIQLYWNERLVKMPCCVSELDCGFDVFMEYYQKIVQECDTELCREDSENITISKQTESCHQASSEDDGNFYLKTITLSSIIFSVVKKFILDWILNYVKHSNSKQD
ncbi:multiple inositol polyphosphate phosphatase 1-like isoform X2 [Clytia hemisphaerica]|uniref:Multiple inositol polyphosphate phosphatase 1 n=2 Tax=Clytia hemisphaerica TaxID=252671 RepID=A0A7M5WUA2_9CNID